ncbi:MAG: hypothetical protein ACYDAR_11910, partial [Thermomicrobiales bacterium]
VRGMSNQHDVDGKQAVETTGASVKRRGLIAGAAALVAAALVSKANTQDAAAANGDTVKLGGDAGGSGIYQIATARTWIATPGTGTPIGTGTFLATNGFGGIPDAKGDGVQGITVGTSNAGTFGRNNELNGVGAWGEAPNGTGTFGDSQSGSGVAGSSTSGAGTYGQSGTGYGAAGVSVSGIGVFGQSGVPPASPPVTTAYGVYGLSNSSYGVVGVTTAAGFGACTGITETTGAAGFLGGTHNASAFAAFFTGATVVQGNFSVTGAKSAAILGKDGNHQLVYCVEAPESWLEDFGTAKVIGGKAVITVDPAFMSLIHTDNYHVFLTEYDNHNDLFVAKRSASGFEVQAKSGTGDTLVSWRLVGKRADIAGARLAKFTLPKINVPTADEIKPSVVVTIPKPRR